MRFFIASGVAFSVLAVCLAMTTYSADIIPQNVAPTDGSNVPALPNIPGGNPQVNSFDFWYGYFLGWKQGLADAQTNAVRPSVQKPTAKPDCKPVGAFCTYHQDCCSLRCLSYLAKCVS